MWGAGGHGKVVADLVRALGHAVAGFVDSDPAKLGEEAEPGGARVVVGGEALLRALDAGEPLPAGADAFALALGDNRLREACLRRLGGHALPALVHPSATVSPSALVGRGTVVFAGAVVNAAARIGDAAIVNTGAVVEHDCELGAAVHLSPRATLAGGVRVGDRAWVGAGATVIPRVEVGADAVVGAGAVVIRDVAAGQTVAGVPARPLAARAAHP